MKWVSLQFKQIYTSLTGILLKLNLAKIFSINRNSLSSQNQQLQYLSVYQDYIFFWTFFLFFATLWYQMIFFLFLFKDNSLKIIFSINNNFFHVSSVTFYYCTIFFKHAFLWDISCKRKLLDKHNTWVLKKTPTLFLLHIITTPVQLEVNHIFV